MQLIPAAAEVFERREYQCVCGHILYCEFNAEKKICYMFCTRDGCKMENVKILRPSIALPIITEL